MPLKDREARKKYESEYAASHREQTNEKMKRYRERHREKIAEERKILYKLNKEKVIQESLDYYYRNKTYINKKRAIQKRKRRHTDHEFKLICSLRSRLHSIIKLCRVEKKNKTMTYVACSREELIAHIEQQFKEGMSWENHGEWHIDHKVPFKFYIGNGGLTEENIYKVMHYSNLQPLWAEENLRKNGKY